MSSGEKDIRTELYRIWNRKLYQWWRYYDEEYLGKALREPLIVLSEAEGELGHWDASYRRLSISVRHIERHPWLEVMETLRHEMAHQYVDEVLQIRGEEPHGAAFRQACKKLRCSPRAREGGESSAAPGADERILRRIKKLLSLSNSPNENEAQAAVNKARRLLLEYNVDIVELDRERSFGNCYLGFIKGRRASYELWLALLLQDFFFVEVLWVHDYAALKDKSGTILQIHGTATNLEMATYVHGYLENLLEQLWQQYKKRRGVRKNRERQRFFAGVLEGFYNKLREQETTIQNSRALVWKGDRRLQEYYRYLHPRVRRTSGRGVSATAAYRDGLEEGRRVTIHPPFTAERTGFGGYLANE